MKKKVLTVSSSILIIIFLLILNTLKKENKRSFVSKDVKKPEYYLTSPWVTERVDWFFVPLPEKWKQNNSEIEKKKEDYAKISNDSRMYELNLKDFFLVCTYINAKDGAYERWDLDLSAKSVINQILYNLECKDISVVKLAPYDDLLQVNYNAASTCEPNNFVGKVKALRSGSHIFLICICHKSGDEALASITERILSGIVVRYSKLTN
jgi:hypothetical protein